MEYGIIGLLILALDIWALINVWGSGSSMGSKIIWTLIILILPVIGLILWFFMGPKGSARAI
ncbi:PLDc N-terminal domain-containing protein [Parasphingorhabdus sp.]|uniref:PLDc N-terminal domain-containing protein n=1 Tax=Parasphingorhabdus sp. TaxID=2709688 RepID=UPI0035938C6D